MKVLAMGPERPRGANTSIQSFQKLRPVRQRVASNLGSNKQMNAKFQDFNSRTSSKNMSLKTPQQMSSQMHSRSTSHIGITTVITNRIPIKQAKKSDRRHGPTINIKGPTKKASREQPETKRAKSYAKVKDTNLMHKIDLM